MSIDYTKMITAQQKAAEALSDAVTAKSTELSEACRAHIVGGVISNALGADYTYPTNNTAEHPDQQNLNGCVTESLLNGANSSWTVPFWCGDTNGNWDRRDHTHTQIRSVGEAVAAHVRDAQNKLKQLNDQLNTTAADATLTNDEKYTAIDSVVW